MTKMTFGSSSIQWLSAKPCPHCKSGNVKRWTLDENTEAYRCNECKRIGIRKHDH